MRHPLAISCVLALAACVDDDLIEDDVHVIEQGLADSWRGPTIAASVQTIAFIEGGTAKCTATVLTDRWLLTSAHCMNSWPAATTSMNVYAADATGFTSILVYAGNVDGFQHPSYFPLHLEWDIGLVYLRDGAVTNFAPRGNLFSDSAHPWYGDYRLNTWVEGTGRGGEVGTGAGCAQPSGWMRRNQQWPDGSSDHFAISDRELLCPGDSGGPWMFELYDAQAGWRRVQFGVHKGYAWGGDVGGSWDATYDLAAAIPIALPWIEQAMRNRMGAATQLVIEERLASGYRYRRYREEPKALLSVSMFGRGTIQTSPSAGTCSSACTLSFVPGTHVQVTATPQAGYRFASWTGCPSASGTTCTLTMDQSKSLSVRFNVDSRCHVDSVCRSACMADCPGTPGQCVQLCNAECTVCP